MTTKLMFINAIDSTRPDETLHAPLGLGYLASALRDSFGQSHFEFKVIDRNVETEIRSFAPDLVGITSVSANFDRAAVYARIAKSRGLPVIMGGVHISALPSSLTDDMDVGVLGEGEKTIVELLDIFESQSCLDPDAVQQVQGIVFKRNGRCVTTQQRPLIEPLDQIPMPARDLLSFSQMTIMTSRGCPYRCVFCSTSCFWGNIRYFSSQYVVNEIAHIAENYDVPLNYICIWDDLFVANVRRLRQIIELLDERQLLGRFTFWCHVRANLVTDGVAQLLKRLGVWRVGMGFESASPPVLKYYKGPTVSVRDNENAVNTLRRHGIIPGPSFIIGAPDETREDVLQTLRFIKKHKLAAAELYLLIPYPGTPLWDDALQRGLVTESMDWDVLQTQRIVDGDASETELIDFLDNAVILSKKLTREELYDLCRLFLEERKRITKRIAREKMVKRAVTHPIGAWNVVFESVRARFLNRSAE